MGSVFEKTTQVRFSHSLKASLPNAFKEDGKSIFSIPLFAKALIFIFSRPSSNTNVFKFLHSSNALAQISVTFSEVKDSIPDEKKHNFGTIDGPKITFLRSGHAKNVAAPSDEASLNLAFLFITACVICGFANAYGPNDKTLSKFICFTHEEIKAFSPITSTLSGSATTSTSEFEKANGAMLFVPGRIFF